MTDTKSATLNSSPVEPANKNGFLSQLLNIRGSLALPRPVPFEEISREIKFTLPGQFMFEGAKSEITSRITPKFHVNHTFTLAPLNPMMSNSVYSFSTGFEGDNSTIYAKIDNTGTVMGRWTSKYLDRLVGKITFQHAWTRGDVRHMWEADYLGNDFVAGLKFDNPNPLAGTSNFVLHYMQSLTKNLSGGIEWVFENPFPNMEASCTNFGLRYSGSNFVLGALLQHYASCNLFYHQKISDKVALCSDFVVTRKSRNEFDSVTTIGAQFAHRMALIRMSLSTKFVTALTWDMQVGDGIVFNFCGEINHLTTSGKFGIGFNSEF